MRRWHQPENSSNSFPRFQPRSEIIASLERRKKCDLLVIGGGLQGAIFAHLARFNGLDTVLLERQDYGSQSSGCCSGLVSGTLGYLQGGGIGALLSGLRGQWDLFSSASHLVSPYQLWTFLPRKDSLLKLKLGSVLAAANLFSRDEAHKHSWLNTAQFSEVGLDQAAGNMGAGFSSRAGIVNPHRLIIDTIVAARQEGAFCLNYAEVDSFMLTRAGGVTVGWTDKLEDEKHVLQAGVVVNCAGPWVPQVGRITPGPLARKVVYGQGTQLLFNKVWPGPAMLFPRVQQQGYYFVAPHCAGTIAGIAERPLKQPVSDPLPEKAEIEEILAWLELNLPDSGLDRSCLHYCFAAIRVGSLSGSRRALWGYSPGLLYILGADLTKAAAIAYKGLKKIFQVSGIQNPCVPLGGRKLPGAGLFAESCDEFKTKAADVAVPDEITKATIHRLGSRVRYIQDSDNGFEIISGLLLKGELDIALEIEQVETLDDLLCRRLGLVYYADHGSSVLPEVLKYLKSKRPELDIEVEEQHYRQKLERHKKLLKSAE